MNANENIRSLRPVPVTIPREKHTISRAAISDSALKVLYRLKNAGYQSFLVGGSVRDLLLGREPKDFDVVTNALPQQIRELFRNCCLIGRRFRLAHIRFGREIIEVSTFRAPHHVSDTGEGRSLEGRIIRDNVYGNIEDDVWRRDFTVNALFYNIKDYSVLDYVGGVADLERGQLRLIGDAEKRYTEDPVRLLRAVRFAVKLGLNIHPDTEAPIYKLAYLLEDIPAARLFEEVLKLFMRGVSLQTFEALRNHGLFRYLFPLTEDILSREEGGFPHTFLCHAFADMDQRFSENKPITPGFLIAALLWEPLQEIRDRHLANDLSESDAYQLAIDTVISKQISVTSMPRHHTSIAREIWSMQPRLGNCSPRRSKRVLAHPRFRAAYDFLLLRHKLGEELAAQVDWWTEQQNTEMYRELEAGKNRNRRRTHRVGHRRKAKIPES